MTKLYLSMPQPGETITEGTLVEWLIKPGAVVQEHTPLAQLETEKAVFEYESPFEGKIVSLLVEDGARVKVASPIGVIDCPDDKAQLYIMMGIGKLAEGESAPEASAPAAQKSQIAAPSTSAPAISAAPKFSGELKMAPMVRKLAHERHLSEDILRQLAGQNPEGRVTKEAILAHLGGQPIPAARVAAPGANSSSAQEVELKPCSPIRMRIAENMVLSKSKIPHAHNGIAVDITALVAFRDKIKDQFKAKHGVGLNLLSLISPVLNEAIRKVPLINSSYDDTNAAKHQIKVFKKLNLGIAAGTEQGLVIPVVKDFASFSFVDLNKHLADKLDRAKIQKLKPDELTGATLIFNNFGFFGTQLGVQVIQYPMAATLGMGVIEKRVVPVGDAIAIRTMTDFVLSFDHRIMDGRETGLFLSALKTGIESLDYSRFNW